MCEMKVYALQSTELWIGEEVSVVIQPRLQHMGGQRMIQRKSIPLRGGCLEQEDGRTHVRVQNLSNKILKIRKNSLIGYVPKKVIDGW